MAHNTNDIDDDFDEQGNPKGIVPDNDEYYTLDLTRGKPTQNDFEEVDIVGDDPLSDDVDADPAAHDGRIIHNKNTNRSANAGGPISSDDAVTQDTESGTVPGEPGHWGVDEGTE